MPAQLAQDLVAAWNAQSREGLLALLSDDLEVTLQGRAGTRINPIASTKREFDAFLGALPDGLPRFSLVSALGDEASVCLSLVDQDGLRLQVICGTFRGRVERMALFRPTEAAPTA